MVATPAPPSTSRYSERLLPGPLGWGLVVMFAAFMSIALYPVGPTLSVVVGSVVLVAGLVAAVVSTPRIAVAGGELWAGQAHIPLDLLGSAHGLDAAATRVELGPALDARAYVCLRAWARTAVRVDVVDPGDPTPYWLISTRHPGELVRALTQAAEQAAQG
jgi:hypothetical protein